MVAALRTDEVFSFDVARPVLWGQIQRLDAYRSWWPWLVEFDAPGLAPGVHWLCALRAPLGFVLRFDLLLGEVIPHEGVTATLTGDLEGTARFSLSDAPLHTTDLRLVSSLVPTPHWLSASTKVVRPLARRSHDRILGTGIAQLRDALRDPVTQVRGRR